MATVTRAAVLRDKHSELVIEDVCVDDPRPEEILVRLVATGLCHTDLLVRDQILPPPLPAVLGHEGSGVVERVGAAVTGLVPGDPVVLAPLSCGTCARCRGGHPMQCPTWGPLNLRGRRPDGSTAYHDDSGADLNGHFFGQSAFAGYVVVHHSSAVKVPADAPLELLGPLGCAILAGAGAVFNVLKPQPGTTMAVFGAGAVGLAAVMAARLHGCADIVAVDLHPARLDLALELGATQVHLASPDVPQRIVTATGGGVDTAVDAVGLPETVTSALASLASGGAAAVAGSAGTGKPIPIDVTALMTRSLHGVLEGDAVPGVLIPRLIDLYRRGRFPFDRMIRRYPLAEINAAVADAETGATVKPILVHDPA